MLAQLEQGVGGAPAVDGDVGPGVDGLDGLKRAFPEQLDVGAYAALDRGGRRAALERRPVDRRNPPVVDHCVHVELDVGGAGERAGPR
jgi:hypothetical protein